MSKKKSKKIELKLYLNKEVYSILNDLASANEMPTVYTVYQLLMDTIKGKKTLDYKTLYPHRR